MVWKRGETGGVWVLSVTTVIPAAVFCTVLYIRVFVQHKRVNSEVVFQQSVNLFGMDLTNFYLHS